MKSFSVILLRERDGSIKTCRLMVEEEGREHLCLSDLTKREVEYLIWFLADARRDLQYIKNESPLFDDLEVDKVAVRFGDLILEGVPPPFHFEKVAKR